MSLFNKEVSLQEMQMRGFPVTLEDALKEAENDANARSPHIKIEYFGKEHPFSDKLPIVSSLEEADVVHFTRIGPRGNYLSVFYLGDDKEIASCWFLTEE